MSDIKLTINSILKAPPDSVLLHQALTELSNSLKSFSVGKDPIFKDCREVIIQLTSFLPTTAKLRTRIWHLTTKTFHVPKCIICDNIVKWDQATQSYRQYCSSNCKNNDPVIKIKTLTTNLSKYGASAPTKNKTISQKISKAWTIKTDQDINLIVNKRKQTNIERYGVDNPTKSSEIRKKVIDTNLERYGAKYYLQTAEGQQKYTKTTMEKYGCHPRKLEDVKNKQKQTNIERYGVDNPTKSPEIKKKVINTNLERYGIPNTNYITNNHMLINLHYINDYGFLYNEYITKGKTAVQIAKDLCIGDTTIGRYLRKVEIEIRKTQQSWVSKLWLENIMTTLSINIVYEYPIPGTRYKVDGYCKETNTIYEFHGDFWHGNPMIYDSNMIHPFIKNKTMGDLYQRTIKRDDLIRSLGYNLIIMWESDYLQT